MRRPATLGLELASAAVLALAAATPRAPAHPEGAPPAHTGGFGEPTCTSCHFGYELDEPGATLRLEGVPDAYAPAERYTLHIVLAMDGLPRGGFQLAARFADGQLAGQQAGTLHPADDRAAAVDFDGVTYASHTYDGTYPTAPDTLRWTLHWTAPETAGADIVFHLVANAADDDESPFGDRIYGGVWALGVGRWALGGIRESGFGIRGLESAHPNTRPLTSSLRPLLSLFPPPLTTPSPTLARAPALARALFAFAYAFASAFFPPQTSTLFLPASFAS